MKAEYAVVADRLADDIAAGRLLPGDRLLPHREFAYRHGIAASTASRVYAELSRRGLVAGEVGRGTYVRTAPRPVSPPLVEPVAATVNLELIFPTVPSHEGTLSHLLARLADSPHFAEALRPVEACGTPAAREAAAGFLIRLG